MLDCNAAFFFVIERGNVFAQIVKRHFRITLMMTAVVTAALMPT